MNINLHEYLTLYLLQVYIPEVHVNLLGESTDSKARPLCRFSVFNL